MVCIVLCQGPNLSSSPIMVELIEGVVADWAASLKADHSFPTYMAATTDHQTTYPRPGLDPDLFFGHEQGYQAHIAQLVSSPQTLQHFLRFITAGLTLLNSHSMQNAPPRSN